MILHRVRQILELLEGRRQDCVVKNEQSGDTMGASSQSLRETASWGKFGICLGCSVMN